MHSDLLFHALYILELFGFLICGGVLGRPASPCTYGSCSGRLSSRNYPAPEINPVFDRVVDKLEWDCLKWKVSPPSQSWTRPSRLISSPAHVFEIRLSLWQYPPLDGHSGTTRTLNCLWDRLLLRLSTSAQLRPSGNNISPFLWWKAFHPPHGRILNQRLLVVFKMPNIKILGFSSRSKQRCRFMNKWMN